MSSSDNLYLKTLARDQVSSDAKKFDDQSEGQKHRLNGNSDFQLLNGGKLDYFFNGQLWKETSYRNSSDTDTQDGNTKRKDYNSVIVWPIRYKLQPGEHYDDNSLKQVLLGFLTVDAIADNVFSERYDVHLGGQVADTLYIVLQRYREVKAKQDEDAAEIERLKAASSDNKK